MFAMFFYQIYTHAISSLRSEIKRRTARVVCAILAHAASRVTFPGYFESTSTKQYKIQSL